jgi:prophage DNA circulation protein
VGWRERYNEIASFRGVEFRIEGGVSRTVGRRSQVHVYPLRDEAYPDDHGAVPEEFRLPGAVFGDDYDRQRDRLLEALNLPGPGTLVHPYYGSVLVQSQPCTLTESTREGGLARFDLHFVRWAAEPYPRRAADTRPTVLQKSDTAGAGVKDDFAAAWSVADLPAFISDRAVALVDKAVAAVEAQVAAVVGDPEEIADKLRTARNLTNQASSLVADPGQLSDALEQLIRDATSIDEAVDEAQRFARSLETFGQDLEPVPTPTATRQQEADNQAAMVRLVSRLGAIESARVATRTELLTREDATEIRNRVAAQLETGIREAATSGDDQTYRDLRDLQAASVRDIDARGARLPSLITVTLPASLPALVLAYRYHADRDREAEIVTRNGIDHPGYVPGSVPLEILVDA